MTDTVGGGESLQSMLRDAVALHQAGQLDRAEGIYREILRERPGHADALHLMGLAAHQQGRNDEAKRLIENAIVQDAARPYYHNNLGEVCRALGDLEAAASHYHAALALDDRYVQAHNNLGMVLHRLDDSDGAARAFRAALAIAPDSAEVHNNLGVVLQAVGELPEAIAAFRRALDLAPTHVEACNNLGAALHADGQLREARDRLEKAVALDPDCGRAHYNLSRLYLEARDAERALESARRAVELEPREASLFVQLAAAHRYRGELEQAHEALRAAIAIDPRHAVAHNDLGVMLLVMGRFEEAVAQFRRALEHDPWLDMAHENLAKARRFDASDASRVERLEARATAPGLSPPGRVHLHFALGKMLDDMGEHDRAFAHFRAGNEAKHATTVYDRGERRRLLDATRAAVDRELLDSAATLGDHSELPVFVLGMPRSGTTLVEQILASHPLVHGAGELAWFRELATRLPQLLGGGPAYPDCLRAIDAARARALAAEYLAVLRARAGEQSERVVDKMPLNFEHLGLISLLFPRARFIHCRRDPRDLCVSIYFQHFAGGNEYADDFAEIVDYCRIHEEYMEHWRTLLPGRIHEVRYEAVVEDLEGATRAMLEHLDLLFDERCLGFHLTERAVGTSSHWQVRQPLYDHAVGRWRNYESHLGPLLGALADAGLA